MKPSEKKYWDGKGGIPAYLVHILFDDFLGAFTACSDGCWGASRIKYGAVTISKKTAEFRYSSLREESLSTFQIIKELQRMIGHPWRISIRQLPVPFNPRPSRQKKTIAKLKVQ